MHFGSRFGVDDVDGFMESKIRPSSKMFIMMGDGRALIRFVAFHWRFLFPCGNPVPMIQLIVIFVV